MNISESSGKYPGNKMMANVVGAERKAFKNGQIAKGVAIAVGARFAGVANMVVGFAVTPVCVGIGVGVAGVCAVGAVATAPLLVTKAAGIPIACGMGVVTGVAIAAVTVVAVVTSPITQIVAPEVFYWSKK